MVNLNDEDAQNFRYGDLINASIAKCFLLGWFEIHDRCENTLGYQRVVNLAFRRERSKKYLQIRHSQVDIV